MMRSGPRAAFLGCGSSLSLGGLAAGRALSGQLQIGKAEYQPQKGKPLHLSALKLHVHLLKQQKSTAQVRRPQATGLLARHLGLIGMDPQVGSYISALSKLPESRGLVQQPEPPQHQLEKLKRRPPLLQQLLEQQERRASLTVRYQVQKLKNGAGQLELMN